MTNKDIYFQLPEVTWSPEKCKMFVKELGKERVIKELEKMFTKEYAENIFNIFYHSK